MFVFLLLEVTVLKILTELKSQFENNDMFIKIYYYNIQYATDYAEVKKTFEKHKRGNGFIRSVNVFK